MIRCILIALALISTDIATDKLVDCQFHIHCEAGYGKFFNPQSAKE